MPSNQELAALLAAATSSGRGDYHGSGDVGKARQQLYDLALDMAEELIRLRESQRRLLHDAVDHGRNHTAELVDCEDMSCAQARAALEVQ